MDFRAFSKIARLSREVVITEKIDGTNAQIVIGLYKDLSSIDLTDEKLPYMCVTKDGIDYFIIAGSRTRYISKENDNMGFGRWVSDNREELVKLGEGRHYGEWWGGKIQRGYGLKEKRFSLFNTSMWNSEWNYNYNGSTNCIEIPICHVVPVLGKGEFETELINSATQALKDNGSYASPGFMNPEGIVIFHTASGYLFKKTLVNDESPKSLVK